MLTISCPLRRRPSKPRWVTVTSRRPERATGQPFFQTPAVLSCVCTDTVSGLTEDVNEAAVATEPVAASTTVDSAITRRTTAPLYGRLRLLLAGLSAATGLDETAALPGGRHVCSSGSSYYASGSLSVIVTLRTSGVA